MSEALTTLAHRSDAYKAAAALLKEAKKDKTIDVGLAPPVDAADILLLARFLADGESCRG